METILVNIVLVIALGIGAQWLAWRIRVPSILLLLVLGFTAGPVLGILPPESLQGDWLYAFVSLSIGIILFEGSLNLRVSELRGVGRAVLNLITLGVLITGILAAAAAYWVLEMPIGLAVVVGAILTVTGPTVVLPLVRYVRPTGRVSTIAKWEGITIDPVGAILAVLVLEMVVVLAGVGGASEGVMQVLLHAGEQLMSTIAVSVGVSVLGAILMVIVLKRHLVPEYLQSPVALMLVVVVFATSNALHEESGLFAATLMGIIMANQQYVTVRSIMKFKEDLQVLLIACLFILLSARLDLSALEYFDERAFIFLGLLIVLVRPVAVMLSCMGTGLNWKEQAFVAWLAPRGIVAAAVAALFAERVVEIYGGEAEALVPIVYFVIVGTVAVYGLTIAPLARRLGMADPNPQGVLFLGAPLWVRQAASAVQDLGYTVLLIDANDRNIELARDEGLPAENADALSDQIFDELNLSGISRLLAVTANDEINTLASIHFTEVFEKQEVYQLAAPTARATDQEGHVPSHLRGRDLFGAAATHAELSRRFDSGGEIRTYGLTQEGAYEAIQAQYDDSLMLLFVARGGNLLVNSAAEPLAPHKGDTVIVMLPAFDGTHDLEDKQYEELHLEASVHDFVEPVTMSEIMGAVAGELAQRLPVPAAQLAEGFEISLEEETAVMAPGLVLPHMRLGKISRSELVLVRCASPVEVETLGVEAQAFLFLVSPESLPGQHLRLLAHLAGRVKERSFAAAWSAATSPEELRDAIRD
ncbi:MAG: cation:proton antiporter [Bacteroidota bacterium]|nr:cation:proton antiporter [Bacteroidota bacterium]MDE2833300.1 cation:proton antiporter [Bacteroidota bacterium]MDE2956593.1 cation:proton antiporter [Bacteroidota bacterium]